MPDQYDQPVGEGLKALYEQNKKTQKDGVTIANIDDAVVDKIKKALLPSLETQTESGRPDKPPKPVETDIAGGKNLFGDIFKKIKTGFMFFLSKSFLVVAGIVGAILANVDIQKVFGLFTAIKETFMSLVKLLAPIVKTLWNYLKKIAFPALVDGVIGVFKNLAEMFTNIKARFDGWSSMDTKEKILSVLGIFSDIGAFLGNMVETLMVTVEKLLGGDGTFSKNIWKHIDGFFSSIGEFLTNLFMNPVETIDGLIMSTFGWMKDIGKWIHETLITPFVNWFQTLLDFSSVRTTLESLINLTQILPNTIKEFLLDPAVKWVGDKFGFDTSAFTDFNIGQLIMKGYDAVIDFFQKTFDFKMPELKMPDWDIVGKMKDIVKSMIEGLPDMLVPDSILKWANAKPKVTETLEKTHPGKMTRDEFMTDKPHSKVLDPKTGKMSSSKGAQNRAYQAYLDGDAPKGAVHSPGASSRAKKRLAKRKASRGIKPRESFMSTLKRHEGEKFKAYQDTEDIWTIGVGFNLEKEGADKLLKAAGIKWSAKDLIAGKGSLTSKEIEKLAKTDVETAQKDAVSFMGGKEQFAALDPAAQDALTNMAFNLGGPRLNQFKDLKKSLQAGDYQTASKDMMDSKWAKQVKGRANELSGQMAMAGRPATSGMQLASAGTATPPGGGVTVVNAPSNNNSSSTHAIIPQNIYGKRIDAGVPVST